MAKFIEIKDMGSGLHFINVDQIVDVAVFVENVTISLSNNEKIYSSESFSAIQKKIKH